jgi:hypothetical protein
MGNFMVLNLFLALLLNSFNCEELKSRKEVGNLTLMFDLWLILNQHTWAPKPVFYSISTNSVLILVGIQLFCDLTQPFNDTTYVFDSLYPLLLFIFLAVTQPVKVNHFVLLFNVVLHSLSSWQRQPAVFYPIHGVERSHVLKFSLK